MSSDVFMNEVFPKALAELDRCLGKRRSATVISGYRVSSYRVVVSGEDPLHLTQRVLVIPVMKLLGYTGLTPMRVSEGRIPGLVMSTVSMNTGISEAYRRVLSSMNADDSPRGIATDGFRWILVDREDGIPRGNVLIDLRPYYIEVLDGNRFRESVPEDRDILSRFVSVFGNRPNHAV